MPSPELNSAQKLAQEAGEVLKSHQGGKLAPQQRHYLDALWRATKPSETTVPTAKLQVDLAMLQNRNDPRVNRLLKEVNTFRARINALMAVPNPPTLPDHPPATRPQTEVLAIPPAPITPLRERTQVLSAFATLDLASPILSQIPEGMRTRTEATIYGTKEDIPTILPTSVSDVASTAPAFKAMGFTLQKQIGAGAMGIVFRAHDDDLDRPVAIKVMIKSGLGPDTKKEARLGGRFVDDDPVVMVFKTGVVNDQYPYQIMRLVKDGRDLHGLPEDLELVPRLIIALGMIKAIHTLHTKTKTEGDEEINHGVLHRDIKPANFLATGIGNGDIVELRRLIKIFAADLGLSRELSEEDIPGRFVGTPLFASPEQAQGKPLTEKSDTWSLGVAIYYVLTGRYPPALDEVMGDAYKILSHLANNIEDSLIEANDQYLQAAGVPDVICRLLSRMTKKKAKDRPTTAIAMGIFERDLDARMPEAQEKELAKASALTRGKIMSVLGGLVIAGAVAIGGYFATKRPEEYNTYGARRADAMKALKAATDDPKITPEALQNLIDALHRVDDEDEPGKTGYKTALAGYTPDVARGEPRDGEMVGVRITGQEKKNRMIAADALIKEGDVFLTPEYANPLIAAIGKLRNDLKKLREKADGLKSRLEILKIDNNARPRDREALQKEVDEEEMKIAADVELIAQELAQKETEFSRRFDNARGRYNQAKTRSPERNQETNRKLREVDEKECRSCYEDGLRAYHRGEVERGMRSFFRIVTLNGVGLSTEEENTWPNLRDRLSRWKEEKKALNREVIASLGWTFTDSGDERKLNTPSRDLNGDNWEKDFLMWFERSKTGDGDSFVKILIEFFLLHQMNTQLTRNQNQTEGLHLSQNDAIIGRLGRQIDFVSKFLATHLGNLSSHINCKPGVFQEYQKALKVLTSHYIDVLEQLDSQEIIQRFGSQNKDRYFAFQSEIIILLLYAYCSSLTSLERENCLDDPLAARLIEEAVTQKWKHTTFRLPDAGLALKNEVANTPELARHSFIKKLIE